jgi:hypothetical protein
VIACNFVRKGRVVRIVEPVSLQKLTCIVIRSGFKLSNSSFSGRNIIFGSNFRLAAKGPCKQRRVGRGEQGE